MTAGVAFECVVGKHVRDGGGVAGYQCPVALVVPDCSTVEGVARVVVIEGYVVGGVVEGKDAVFHAVGVAADWLRKELVVWAFAFWDGQGARLGRLTNGTEVCVLMLRVINVVRRHRRSLALHLAACHSYHWRRGWLIALRSQ
jgi:hypothetical protein